ncbi:hypothetical protein ACEWY4_008471 [Coilia grayii]|uniref:Uncharacterized protein n=1 Tax=Coilia grayii TaxID=363190 RepID=A0ABD1KB01_9TELE
MVYVGVRGWVLMAVLSLMIPGGLGVGRSDAGNIAPPPSPSSSDPVLNEATLAQIIRYFKTEYQKKQDNGKGVQFAAAINIAGRYCTAFDNNFLDGEDSAKVKEAINNGVKLYTGEKLVAARPQFFKRLPSIHSERRLLMCVDNNTFVTPMQNLLNNNQHGCVVFYTYNSPCLELCLNQTEGVQSCILDSLSMLTNHRGLKAFVFSQVYRNDIGEEKRDKLAAGLRLVAKQVPLYKCSDDSCVKCLSGNQIVPQCLSNT